jgi:hypothetical protein
MASSVGVTIRIRDVLHPRNRVYTVFELLAAYGAWTPSREPVPYLR